MNNIVSILNKDDNLLNHYNYLKYLKDESSCEFKSSNPCISYDSISYVSLLTLFKKMIFNDYSINDINDIIRIKIDDIYNIKNMNEAFGITEELIYQYLICVNNNITNNEKDKYIKYIYMFRIYTESNIIYTDIRIYYNMINDFINICFDKTKTTYDIKDAYYKFNFEFSQLDKEVESSCDLYPIYEKLLSKIGIILNNPKINNKVDAINDLYINELSDNMNICINYANGVKDNTIEKFINYVDKLCKKLESNYTEINKILTDKESIFILYYARLRDKSRLYSNEDILIRYLHERYNVTYDENVDISYNLENIFTEIVKKKYINNYTEIIKKYCYTINYFIEKVSADYMKEINRTCRYYYNNNDNILYIKYEKKYYKIKDNNSINIQYLKFKLSKYNDMQLILNNIYDEFTTCNIDNNIIYNTNIVILIDDLIKSFNYSFNNTEKLRFGCYIDNKNNMLYLKYEKKYYKLNLKLYNDVLDLRSKLLQYSNEQIIKDKSINNFKDITLDNKFMNVKHKINLYIIYLNNVPIYEHSNFKFTNISTDIMKMLYTMDIHEYILHNKESYNKLLINNIKNIDDIINKLTNNFNENDFHEYINEFISKMKDNIGYKIYIDKNKYLPEDFEEFIINDINETKLLEKNKITNLDITYLRDKEIINGIIIKNKNRANICQSINYLDGIMFIIIKKILMKDYEKYKDEKDEHLYTFEEFKIKYKDSFNIIIDSFNYEKLLNIFYSRPIESNHKTNMDFLNEYFIYGTYLYYLGYSSIGFQVIYASYLYYFRKDILKALLSVELSSSSNIDYGIVISSNGILDTNGDILTYLYNLNEFYKQRNSISNFQTFLCYIITRYSVENDTVKTKSISTKDKTIIVKQNIEEIINTFNKQDRDLLLYGNVGGHSISIVNLYIFDKNILFNIDSFNEDNDTRTNTILPLECRDLCAAANNFDISKIYDFKGGNKTIIKIIIIFMILLIVILIIVVIIYTYNKYNSEFKIKC